jgi:site-specific DNA-methyltransferase (adenine-specific)
LTPYYEQDGITIYHGDCREILPDVSADVMVVDPPYGTGGWRRIEGGRGSDPTASLVVEGWDDGATEFVALAKCEAALVFWPPARTRHLLDAADARGWTKHRGLYWQKPDPKPQVGGRIMWSVEPIWCLSEDGFVLYGGTDWHGASTPRSNRDIEAVGHPYQKPISVMSWLVAKTRAETILDPFMGSGTTLRAAKDLGRKAIGIEIEERYCEIAAKRLQQSVMALEIPA